MGKNDEKSFILRFSCDMLTRVLKITFQSLLSNIFPKEEGLTVFGTSSGKFADNPKYAFLELEDDNSVWIAEEEETASILREEGFRSYSRNSWKGRYICLRAEKAVISHNIEDISFLASGATVANLWHGIALKNIKKDYGSSLKSSLKDIYNRVFFSSDYFLLTGNKHDDLYSSQTKGADIIRAGYPRNDIFYRKIKGSDLFAEQGKEDRFVLYMPTYRDNADFEEKTDLKKLDRIFSDKNTELKLLFKPHPNTDISQDFDNIIVIESQKDLYPLLKSSEALITDYSSIMFDYMHTGNPIIRFQFDKEEYEDERGLNQEMKDFQPGEEVETIKQLEDALQNLDFNTDYQGKIEEVFEARKEGLQAPHMQDQID